MRNAIAHRKGLKEGSPVVLNTDTTFNLIAEGFCNASIGTRNTRRVQDHMIGEYMPFCFMVARTERGELVANMLTSMRLFLKTYEDDFDMYWDLVILDHKDGTITAIGDIQQGVWL